MMVVVVPPVMIGTTVGSRKGWHWTRQVSEKRTENKRGGGSSRLMPIHPSSLRTPSTFGTLVAHGIEWEIS